MGMWASKSVRAKVYGRGAGLLGSSGATSEGLGGHHRSQEPGAGLCCPGAHQLVALEAARGLPACCGQGLRRHHAAAAIHAPRAAHATPT